MMAALLGKNCCVRPCEVCYKCCTAACDACGDCCLRCGHCCSSACDPLCRCCANCCEYPCILLAEFCARPFSGTLISALLMNLSPFVLGLAFGMTALTGDRDCAKIGAWLVIQAFAALAHMVMVRADLPAPFCRHFMHEVYAAALLRSSYALTRVCIHAYMETPRRRATCSG